MNQIAKMVAEATEPFAMEFGCSVWDVEYVREAGSYYLRIFLDHPDGVSIEQCEGVSRKMSDWLDETDPIENSYVLEVSSAGIDRPLKRERDFHQFMGHAVDVKLYRARDGKKDYVGELIRYDQGNIKISTENGELSFSKEELALVRLHVDF